MKGEEIAKRGPSTRDPITINLGDEEAGTMLHAYVWASFVTAKSLEVVYFFGI